MFHFEMALNKLSTSALGCALLMEVASFQLNKKKVTSLSQLACKTDINKGSLHLTSKVNIL